MLLSLKVKLWLILYLLMQSMFVCLFAQSNTSGNRVLNKQELYRNKIDSLKTALANAKHDTLRCNILTYIIFTENDDKIWSKYNDQLFEISKNYLKTNGELKRLYFRYHTASINNKAFLAERKGNISEALQIHEKNLKLRTENNDEAGIAYTLNNMGLIYKNLGDLYKALNCFNGSMMLQEKMNNKYGIALCLNNLGLIYSQQSESEKALENYLKCLKIREEISDNRGIAVVLNNIGSFYKNKGDYKKAIAYYQKGLIIFADINDVHGGSKALNNIGALYEREYNTDSAFFYHSKCLNLRKQIGDKEGICLSKKNLARLYLIKGKINLASQYANESMTLARELGFPESIKNAANILKQIRKKEGNYKEALEMSELEVTMRDSINSVTTRKASIKSQLKYEYEKRAAADSVSHAKESEIKNVELAKQKTEIRAKKNQQSALFGGLGLVILFAGFMYNRFKITQKQKNIIETQKLCVEEQKLLVETKQNEILDSIRYAKRIQLALMPTTKNIEKIIGRLKN